MASKKVRELFVKAQEKIKAIKKDNKALKKALKKDQKFILDKLIENKAECTNYITALAFLMKKARIKDSKKASSKKGKKKVADNIKLGDMGSHMALPGDVTWYIPELDLYIIGTCSGFCSGCFDSDCPGKSACYVIKSIVRHTARNDDDTKGDPLTGNCTVKLGQAYRTLAMVFFRDFYFDELDTQLTNKKKKFPIIRINESGELTCYDDLSFWCELADKHPETRFYLYTKNYKAVMQAVKMDIIPFNLFINISIWHKFGIKEYQSLSSHPQIRAYVLIDSNVTLRAAKRNKVELDEFWDEERYAKEGLHIDGWCSAYDIGGKMNHKITCDNCGKTHCFSNMNKVTACYDHR